MNFCLGVEVLSPEWDAVQELLASENETFDGGQNVRMQLRDRRRVPLGNIDCESRRQIHKFKDCLQSG